jgi:hypothetical protein
MPRPCPLKRLGCDLLDLVCCLAVVRVSAGMGRVDRSQLPFSGGRALWETACGIPAMSGLLGTGLSAIVTHTEAIRLYARCRISRSLPDNP